MKRKIVVAFLCIIAMLCMVSCKDDIDIIPTVEPPKVANIDDGVASVQCDSVIRLSMPVEGVRVYYSLDGTSYKEYENKTGIVLSEIEGLSDSISLSFYAEKDGMNRSDVVKKVYEVIHCNDSEVAEEQYLKTEATKTDRAVYYRSCSVCGKKYLDATFEYGEILGYSTVLNNIVLSVKSGTGNLSVSGVVDRAKTNWICETPENVNGVRIAGIESEAFIECTGLTSIMIPGSVTSIGKRAFYNCSSLTEIHAESFTKDEWRRMSKDASIPSLATVYLKDGARDGRIEKGGITYFVKADGTRFACFAEKSIIKADIPNEVEGDSVTSIGEYAFFFCSELTSVTIPDSVTTIGGNAFYGCSGLTSITMGDSVTTIGDRAFTSCTNLTSITIPDSVTTIGDGAFGYSGLTSITMGDSVTTIGSSSFYNCSGLTSVLIPDSVTTIGDGAFYGCSNLSSVTIPDSITSIGGLVFYGCDGLTSVTIPDSVTTIGNGAFYSCNDLTSVKIPDSVTTIDALAFAWCSGLSSVTIGDSVTTIEGWAFEGCSSLTSVKIGDSVTTIGIYAFHACCGLTSVTIGDSVTTIGSGAFSGCDELTEIRIDRPKNSISGAPWGASNATVKWKGEF